MNQPATYTPLESLFLFQSLGTQGLDGGAFARISEQLRNNALIKSDDTYDPSRLSPEALQQLFFRLLQQEFRGDAADGGSNGDGTNNLAGAVASGAAGAGPDGSVSPGSKKRKLGSPPAPTLKDVSENIEKIPLLVDRLYARYRDSVVTQIREEEKRFDLVQREIQLIEKNEKERLARIASGQQKPTPPLGATPIKPIVGTSSAAQQAAAAVASSKRGQTPIVPPKPPAGVPTPGHLPPGAALVRPPTTQAANGSAPTLLTNVAPPVNRALQSASPVPKVPISPRPEVAVAKPKDPAAPQTAAAAQAAQGTLKWEKPYQPPQTGAPGTPGRPFQPTLPKVPIQPATQTANQQQWQQQQQGSPQPQQLQPQPLQPASQVQPAQPPQVPQARPGQDKPGLVPHVPAGHSVSSIQPIPPRPTGTAPSPSPQPQPRPQSKTPVPPPHHRPIQPQQAPPGQGQVPPRPITASPTPPAGSPAAVPPPQRWPQSPHLQQAKPQGAGAATNQKDRPYSSPYATQPPRPAIPEHMIRHAAAGTPVSRRTSTISPAPQTPIQITPVSLSRGLGTKWTAQSSPSTPGPYTFEPESPAFETVSPPLRPASIKRSGSKPPKLQTSKLTQAPDAPAQRGGRGRGGRGGRGRATSTATGRRSQSVVSQSEEPSIERPESAIRVKDEVATPRLQEETGDTTADESVSGKVSKNLKRKREDTPLKPAESTGPPKEVLWTRGFTKVSSSALDQISSHRDANMFATALRERDAPNYRQIVLQPQDITSIRSAIKHGNKAAVQAANSLNNGDPGTTSVLLPISEDLVPPKGIINSAQLERELVHMFCNAIMYNPDPDRGPGQSFMKRSQEEEEEILGYHLDENGIVRNTQSMFVEVEKLLGDLRHAEKDRIAPPSSTPRPTSVAATPVDDTAAEEDEETGAEGDGGSGTIKRRRLATKS